MHPRNSQEVKHLCVGDTPVLAMVLKLPCTHFPLPIFLPCPSSCSMVHSPAHPPQANQGDKIQVSLLLTQQSPLYRHCHCFLFPAPCGSPGGTACWPQAHGECLVPCSAPAHRSLWVGLSQPVLLLLLVPGPRRRPGGQRWPSACEGCSNPEHTEIPDGLGTVQCSWWLVPAEPIAAAMVCCSHILNVFHSLGGPCHPASDTRRAAWTCR